MAGELDEYTQFILENFSPESLSLPRNEAEAASMEILHFLATAGRPKLPPEYRQKNETKVKTPSVVLEEQPSTDCAAVQLSRRKRFVRLSLMPGLMPAANIAIRSRLFTTSTGPRIQYNTFTEIASWHKNISISYKGEELRQDDSSVWFQLCKIAAKDPDFKISCTMYQLLKSLRLTDTGKNRKKVREQLDRLSDAKIFIRFDDIEYKGTILPEYAVDGTGKILANLSATISQLLGIYDFTMLKEDVHFSIPKTTQWFHAFLQSQAGPEVVIPWDKIKELSGTQEDNMDNFQRNFRKVAIKHLKEIGIITSAKTSKGNLVVVIDKDKG